MQRKKIVPNGHGGFKEIYVKRGSGYAERRGLPRFGIGGGRATPRHIQGLNGPKAGTKF